jgi:hypothetical protein
LSDAAKPKADLSGLLNDLLHQAVGWELQWGKLAMDIQGRHCARPLIAIGTAANVLALLATGKFRILAAHTRHGLLGVKGCSMRPIIVEYILNTDTFPHHNASA